jgi:hypothetical protein
VLNPTGFGVDLLVLTLIDTRNLAAVIEDHKAGAGGTLIDGKGKGFRHGRWPFADVFVV